MTAVVSKYYKGISAERRKKEFFKAVGFEPRQVNQINIIRTKIISLVNQREDKMTLTNRDILIKNRSKRIS